jgi:molybdate/tungstate transport system substrate-binding protein
MFARRVKSAWLAPLWLLLVLIFSLTACNSNQSAKIRMTVLTADSLIIPFQEIEKSFEVRHPDIDVLIEGHGSIQVIRAVTELGTQADIAAVADNQLIPLMMYQAQMPDGSGQYAEWYVNFAANSLGIAYTGRSAHAAELNADNWYSIMSRPDVKIGLADPLIDSLGYRALMAVQLAEDYYRDRTIFQKLIGPAFDPAISRETWDNITTVHIPEILQPALERVSLRSYSLQVLALLESGNVDYSFEYASVALQHGLKFLPLPAAIALSAHDLAGVYNQVKVKMDFQRFASVMPEFQGAPIIYAVTIPGNAPHPPAALTFLTFLLGGDGQQILSRNFQPPLVPPTADQADNLPGDLRRLVK